MEQVLDVYTAPADPDQPLICMDEAAKQLVDDEQQPIPMTPGQPIREDYHYQRCGVGAIFMFFDPLRGWRRTAVRDSRTREDWAYEVRRLLDQDYPRARRVRLVCDNLNTHHIASLYHAFPAYEAHRLARRLELVYTPRHGSWLNMAEIELSAAARQCLDHRIPSLDQLDHQLSAWTVQRNADASAVRWRMTTPDARIKLQRLYPQF